MKVLWAISALVLVFAPTALAQDASSNYSISNEGRYCELRVGQRTPSRAPLIRTFRQYVESGTYNTIRVYGACGGRVPVEVLLDERRMISDIKIKKQGICVDGGVCIGDTLATARKALPSARTFVLFEEGQVLYMRLSPFLTLGVEVEDVDLECPEIPDDKCLRSVLSRPIADITISNRIKP
jgi:hypothetical protein